MKKSKKSKQYSIFKLAARTVTSYVKTSKWWALLDQSFAVLHSLSWTVGIIATQVLFDAITAAAAGELSFWQVAAPLGVLAAVTVGQQVINGLENFTNDALMYRNYGRFMAQFQRKLSRLPAKHFEDTAFLDDVNKAKEGADWVGYFAFICTQIFTYYAVFFVSVGVYLFWLSPLLPLVILAAFVPAILGQLAQVKVFAKLEEENAPLRRQNEYYQRTIADREFYKETRILGGFNYFRRLFHDTLMLVTGKTWKTEKKAAIIRFLLNIASFAGLGASIVLLFNATMAGAVTVGAFAAVFAALNRIFSVMDEIVTYHLSSGSEHLGKIANYYRLMDMDEMQGTANTLDFSKGISAENISFTYPGRDEAAISGVSLEIREGETIAIVGENGAGKSTLVRLLTGIYQPDAGTVKVGGLDTKSAHPSAVFGGISGVFQRYQRYKMTLSANVGISSTKTPINADNIGFALAESEFNEPAADLDTMLSPEFDGIDLSGGQWQRLAIARGLYRSHDFIVLD
ncbi:MAG: ABC transporter ATP-binding protein/permease, partial [Defluviitaleaceae bacterium]|nr:ABC transporter ATP-binding protein/permease [Defluviitaleaceae bacterium]